MLRLLAGVALAAATSLAQAPGNGTLSVTSDPPAKIAIDGADTGKTTPASLELKSGDHKLTLTTADGSVKRTLGFKVSPGQTTKLNIKL